MSMNRCMTLSHDLEFEIVIVKLHGQIVVEPENETQNMDCTVPGRTVRGSLSPIIFKKGILNPRSKFYLNDSDRIDQDQ